MYRTATQLVLLLFVMVVAVGEFGGAALARPTTPEGLTQDEVALSIVINQLAILQNMNESSSVCASRETELRELRLLREETKAQLKELREEVIGEIEEIKAEVKGEVMAMNAIKVEAGQLTEEVKGQIECMNGVKEDVEIMKEEVKGQIEGMNGVKAEAEVLKEEVNGQMEAVNVIKGEVETMRGKLEQQMMAVKEMLDSVCNMTTPDPPALDTPHNDTDPSLCGPNKVLIGSRGSLSPSHPSHYRDDMKCEWRVILPEGTHPVFRWEYFQTEDCHDTVTVTAPGVLSTPNCGFAPPSLHPMYNFRDNEFTVTFSSDGSVIYRGFLLHYQAEADNFST